MIKMKDKAWINKKIKELQQEIDRTDDGTHEGEYLIISNEGKIEILKEIEK